MTTELAFRLQGQAHSGKIYHQKIIQNGRLASWRGSHGEWPRFKDDLVARRWDVLKCGYYFTDFINKAHHQASEVLTIHLYPTILREIFRNELPTFSKANQRPSLRAKRANATVMGKFIDSLLFYFDDPRIVTEEIPVLKVAN